MPDWLAILLGVSVAVTAAYLLYVIQRPEDF